MSDISKAAADDIAEHKAATRKPVSDEMGRIVASRGGAVTQRQLEIIASTLSYLVTASQLSGELMIWLAHHRVAAETARPFYDSATWADVLKRAQAAELGESRAYKPLGGKPRKVDPRKDWSIPEIYAAFEIGDAEIALLGLRLLVPHKQRLADDRIREGVVPGNVGRPPRTDRPKDEGVSLRTLQRREKQAKEAAHAALVDRVAEVSRNSRLSGETEKSSGEDGPTVDSTQQPTTIPCNDNLEFRDTGSAVLIQFDSYQPWPPVCPAPPSNDDTPTGMLRTAAARRLAVLASRLGMKWSPTADPKDPGTWWEQKPGNLLSPSDATDLEIAVIAARREERRREAIDFVRARDAAKAAPAKPEATAKTDDEYACPARVSPDVWEALPRELRPSVLKKAGAWFLYGWPPDDAILIGLEQIMRMNAIVEAVLTVEPDADRDDLTNMAHDRWNRSTEDAVKGIVSALGLRRDRHAKAEAAVIDAVDKSESPIHDADRDAVVEKATDVLTGWPNNTARHAVSLAVDIVRDRSVEARQTVDKATRAEAEAAIVAAIPFAKPPIKDEDHGRIIAIGAHLMVEDPDLAAGDAVRQAVRYWQDQRQR